MDVLEADAVEAAGDAAKALRIMARRPLMADGRPFWRPWRIAYLQQLCELDPVPGWVVSRWILAQATQSLRHGDVRRALTRVVELRGGVDRLPGLDAADAEAKVVDHDWVFRQLLLFETGALGSFLRGSASPALLQRADRVEEWARAPMGAYRLRRRTPATVVWDDVATGAEVVVPNTGCSLLVLPGEHVIGRLVPAGAGQMFESAPLVVPEQVAQRVATEPASWFEALRAERDERGSCAVVTSGHQTAVVTDVRMELWVTILFPGAGRPWWTFPTPEEIVDTVLGEAAEERRRTSPPGHDEVDLWPCLAAALLEPGVGPALAARARGEDAEAVAHLAEVLAEPAGEVCRRAMTPRADAA
ncbi:hypothetical protein [Nocardioides taihuensis]|uniref:Uncharacterized protein n=1 Tax=Nocardioides taihuensis TaxID=1835606 RepID=A0ABW0BKW5_9ACTN